MTNFAKSVEYNTVALPGATAVDSALTKSQTHSNCIPFCGINYDSTNHNANRFKVDILYGSAPEVTAKRSNGDGTVNAGIYTLEIDTTGDVTVQQGTFSIANGNSGTTEAITAVVTTRAFIIIAYEFQDTRARPERFAVTPVFNSTTELGIQRNGTGDDVAGHYFVVATAGTDFLVEHDTIAIASTAETANETITAITLASTFILRNWLGTGVVEDILETGIVVDLSSTTNARARRAFNDFGDTTADATCSDAATVEIQVVSAVAAEFTVERFECNFGDALTKDVTVAEIDQARAIVNPGGVQGAMSSAEAAAGDLRGNFATMPFNSDTVVRGTRLTNTDPDGTTMFEVVEFALTAADASDTEFAATQAFMSQPLIIPPNVVSY